MTELLKALYEEDWAFEMGDNAEFASLAGFHDIDRSDALQDVSPAGYQRRAQHSRLMRDKLRDILSTEQGKDLSGQAKVFATLFDAQHAEVVDNIENSPLYLFPINSMGAGGPLNAFSESIEWMRMETAADAAEYLRRLQDVPNTLIAYRAAMDEGVVKGFTASKAMLREVEEQLKGIIAGPFAEYTAPMENMTTDLLPADSGVRTSITEAIACIRAAYQEFLIYLQTIYFPVCRDDPACSALPNGLAIYEACLRFHTTTTLSPEEVHNIGISEVAKIEARYQNEVLAPLGYGSGPGEFTRFVEMARENKKYYVNTSEELVAIYRKLCSEIAEIMPTYFADIPQTPLEITTRNVGPAAYYLTGTPDGKRPGRFYVNVSHIEKRPLYETVALALHEAIPGHHHQISLAIENAEIPNFMRYIEDRRYEAMPCRRNIYTGYAEGWALYCEYLGEEMGMYKSPVDLFGRLSMDMMRAVRLVVDTGLHYKGWSIERCVEYMMEKTGMHRHEVETEIYRYAGWPGQACGYKIGQIEIINLRRKAESELGDKFDLKKFHAICLNSGPLPLTQLAALVEAYISDSR